MAWFKVNQTLTRHPKLKRLARGLGISEPTAIGHLILLWGWAMDYAPDGDISEFDAEDIAGVAGWDGDADTFIAALLSCGIRGDGFLERTEDGGLIFHDWEENIGSDLEQRRKAAEKIRKYRAKKKSDLPEACNGVRNGVRNGHDTGYVTVACNGYVTGEKRGDEKRGEEIPPLPPQGGGGAGGGQTGGISSQSQEPQGFGAFWAAYPRRVQRQAAVKAWRGLLRQAGATAADVTEAARAYAEAAARRGTPPDKIMHPATFLHEERWRDWLPPGGASYLEALGAGGRGRAQAPQDAPMTYEEAVARYRGGAGAVIDVEYRAHEEGGGDSAKGGLSALS